MKWGEILKAIPVKIEKNCLIKEAIQKLIEANAEIGFVYEQEIIVGYIDYQSLCKQIELMGHLEQTVQYETNILKVRDYAPIEFYHNSDCIIGVNKENHVIGYTTVVDARHEMNRLMLEHMNKSIDSAEFGVITTNNDFEIIFMNEVAENILGLSRSFLIGRNYKTLITVEEDIQEVLMGKRLISVKSSFNFKQMSGHFSPIYKEGKVNGIVHIFYLQEHWKEAVNELEFVKELNEDFQAIYSSSNEQILVVNLNGVITRLAGTFLKDFWHVDTQEPLIGANVYDLEKEGFFTPNVVSQCIKEEKKVSIVQQNAKTKIWSTATPIYKDGEFQKVVVISRDITEVDRLKEELAVAQTNNHSESTLMEKPLVYRSNKMKSLVGEMGRIAVVDSTVLLIGESGVGKEVFARHLHSLSDRQDKPFMSVNCGAIPDNLLESELFGHEKGAFTSAVERKVGLFEAADGGTVLLDEITEMPFHMQVKLLRVIQEREIVRVGGIKPIKIDVRIIAATNRDLKKMVYEKKFREDLYYRLHVIPIFIPPLRQRKDDIISLSLYFLQQLNEKYRKEKRFSREALQLLESYRWPGNVRELQNVVERLVVTTKQVVIQQKDVYQIIYQSEIENEESFVSVYGIMPLKDAVDEVESQLIKQAINKYGTAAKAAEVLGISPSTISRRMKKVLN
ncbi:sigma 54-interacting transcriptional regulator [Bacillus sp. FJAT-47783]|uniref:sigma 54-interacting transcriptional regulator n=1 Tax=Bacillus sp. FJAT-47783 TaxID=2922712 RepID=UPI001FAB687E|nr:sigma 54-interacting transcriptional regulator [Bacillus sp. FJAT-47783]